MSSTCQSFGTTSRRICRARRPGAPSRHSATDRPGRSGAALPDGADHAGGQRPSATSRSRSRYATFTASGARRRCIARGGWKRPSIRRRKFITNTKASSPAGSHKPNTAVAQAFYNKEAGVKKITTETGAGQWGSSLAFAGALFGLEIQVFMVKVSLRAEALSPRVDGNLRRDDASPARRTRPMRAARSWRRTRTATAASASPSPRRSKSRRSATTPNTRSGSVLNHVLLHQTVIGRKRSSSSRWPATIPTSSSAAPAAARISPASRFRSSAQQLRGGKKRAHHRGRAGGVPEPHERQVRLRLRRHRPPDAAGEDAHAGLDLHAARLPRRRPALSRHGAAGVAHQGTRA